MAKDKFIEEIRHNIKADRERLTDLYDSVKKLAKDSSDILGLATVSESLVKIADSLTKQNSQLVDLAKLTQKALSEEKPSSTASGFTDSEIEELHSEIVDGIN